MLFVYAVVVLCVGAGAIVDEVVAVVLVELTNDDELEGARPDRASTSSQLGSLTPGHAEKHS